MENTYKLILIVTLLSSFVIFILLALICACKTKGSTNDESWDKESSFESKEKGVEELEINGDLIRFEGGEDLNCVDILDAPGEVIGKSSYGTSYRANLVRKDAIVLLRFLRPSCTENVQDLMHVVQLLGSIRHPNLVPLCGFYSGGRGEKLLVHPYYLGGNLAQLVRDKNSEYREWTVISTISSGIARGLYHLHTGLKNPMIHGNLKSKNILLGQNHHPFVSDFGLHVLLNPTAAQQMLDEASMDGYKAPELIKVKDMSKATDIYNFGMILLELLNGKEPSNVNMNPNQDFCFPTSLKNVNEERVLGFFRLVMACCSPLPSLRPDIKAICKKLEEL